MCLNQLQNGVSADDEWSANKIMQLIIICFLLIYKYNFNYRMFYK